MTTDENGNTNCSNLQDCYDCKNSSNCTGCSRLDNCSNMQNSDDCTNSSNCTDCTVSSQSLFFLDPVHFPPNLFLHSLSDVELDAQDLIGCSNCTDCSGLKNASNQTGVHKSEYEL
ncbi:hypothetical protein Daus18300_008264 [Diaporthe australafricana]|uniref:Uncharacterized protein n=1 Tax=Diaporthe australafricana TaxID=127596 RepID=A0ABR3WJG5_9PEZI